MATVKSGRNLRQRQARQLLAADRAQRDETRRQQRLEELQAAIAKRVSQAPAAAAAAATAAETKELARLLNAARRHEKYHRARALKIEEIHRQILTNLTAMSSPRKLPRPGDLNLLTPSSKSRSYSEV